MSEPQAARKDATPNPSEAGAPFDAPCVTSPAGVAPASLAQKSRQWFAPLAEFSERDNCKGDCNHGNR
jgi:hypothetical protein